MTALPVAEPGYRLLVGDPETLSLTVVRSPQQSVIEMLLAASSARRVDGVAWQESDVARVLRPSSRFAVDPMVAALRHGFVPCAAVPIPPFADVSVREQVGRLRESCDELGEELSANYGNCLPGYWQPALNEPRAWFRSLAHACLDTWSVLGGVWREASPSLDREARRVGTAAVRGGLDVLLNSLHPRLRYHDGVLTMRTRGGHDSAHHIGGRRLALVPMVGCRTELLASFDRDDIAYIGYPLPGAAALGQPPARSASDALALLLGPVRAAALRALNLSMTVGELARSVQCALNTASYHCDQLERAGLIVRERRGQAVQVSRTLRGDELIDLMS